MSEWRTTTLGSFISLRRGHDLPQRNRRSGSVPVVGSGGTVGWHDTAVVTGPGITVGRAANLGAPTLTETDFWPLNTTLYVTDFHGNDVRFTYYLLRTLDLTGFNSGSVQPMLNRNYIRNFPISVPEPSEQKAIADLLGALDDKIAANERISQASTQLAVAHGQHLLAAADGDEVALADHAEVVKGVSYRSVDLGSGSDRLVTLKCVGRDGSFQNGGLKRYSGDYKEAQVVQNSDIVVAQTDLTQRAEVIGRPVRVSALGHRGRLVASLDLVIMRPGRRLSREVLLALLSTQDFRDHAISYCNGTTVLHMGARALPEYRFRLPHEEIVNTATEVMAPLLGRSDSAQREGQTLVELRDTLLPGLMSGAIRVRDAEKIAEDVT